MKILKFILFFLCSFLIYFNVDACTTKELSDLRKIANNIKFDYDVYLDENEPFVYFSLYNMNNLFYIKEKPYNTSIYYNNETIMTRYGYKDDINYRFIIYGSNYSNCKNEVILDKYITIPRYNPYYNNKACDGVKEFVLCGKYSDLNLSSDEFLRRVNEYKKKQNKEDKPVEKSKEENRLLNFMKNNYIYFIIVFGIIVISMGVIINVKKKK